MLAAFAQGLDIGLLVGVEPGLGQQAGHAQHAVQRGAQFVAEGGEIALASVQAVHLAGIGQHQPFAVGQVHRPPHPRAAALVRGLQALAGTQAGQAFDGHVDAVEQHIGCIKPAFGVDHERRSAQAFEYVCGPRHCGGA